MDTKIQWTEQSDVMQHLYMRLALAYGWCAVRLSSFAVRCVLVYVDTVDQSTDGKGILVN
jgi:hypothetical protein